MTTTQVHKGRQTIQKGQKLQPRFLLITIIVAITTVSFTNLAVSAAPEHVRHERAIAMPLGTRPDDAFVVAVAEAKDVLVTGLCTYL